MLTSPRARRHALPGPLVQLRSIVMIECGGTVDLTRMLTVGPNVTIYVVDSHRPYNLVNVYVAKHVRPVDSHTGRRARAAH